MAGVIDGGGVVGIDTRGWPGGSGRTIGNRDGAPQIARASRKISGGHRWRSRGLGGGNAGGFGA
jgi:hypothetical protein